MSRVVLQAAKQIVEKVLAQVRIALWIFVSLKFVERSRCVSLSHSLEKPGINDCSSPWAYLTSQWSAVVALLKPTQTLREACSCARLSAFADGALGFPSRWAASCRCLSSSRVRRLSLLALSGIVAHPRTDGGCLPSKARGYRIYRIHVFELF